MANQKLYARDIMTANPVTVEPEDSVVYAARILFENNFNGLPVINEQKEVVGILTEYDLISKGGDLHMSTLINILGNLDTYKKDSSLVKDEIKRLMILKVKEIMNAEPLTVGENAPIKSVAELFASHHKINPILVSDQHKKLTGVISRFDLVKFFAAQDISNKIDLSQPAVLDKKVVDFIHNFEKKISVSGGDVRLRALAGVLLVLVGVSMGLALILRFLN